MVVSTDAISPNALTDIGYIRRPPLNGRYMKAALVEARRWRDLLRAMRKIIVSTKCIWS